MITLPLFCSVWSTRRAELARAVTVVSSRRAQVPLAGLGVIALTAFLVIHTVKDLSSPAAAWYFRSTPVWILVMAIGSVVYLREVRALRRDGVDLHARFATLPPE